MSTDAGKLVARLVALAIGGVVVQNAFVPALLVTEGGPANATTTAPLHLYVRAFEYGGDATCMPLPEPDETWHGVRDLELMHHQAQVVTAAAEGHRTFLLADEPGLGKTAQALLAVVEGVTRPIRSWGATG